MLVIAALLPAGWGLALPASVPALLVALAALILGMFCICALENVTMGLTMRTLDPRGVQALLNLLLMTFSGNILPLTLFPDSWQRAITLLPYAQMLDGRICTGTGTGCDDNPALLDGAAGGGRMPAVARESEENDCAGRLRR